MRVAYVVSDSKVPWCADFAAEGLAKYSKHEVVRKTNFRLGGFDVIHFHNVQSCRNFQFSRFSGECGLVGGVRGLIGFHQWKDRLHWFDALAVNVDQQLVDLVSKDFRDMIHVIPVGEDPELFKPAWKWRNPFTVGWVGRDHKPFKNADLLPQLKFPYRKTTYRDYIPHREMPGFYHGVNALVEMSDHHGFCRPIVEAAMCGLPIVSNDLGVARDIVDRRWIVQGDPREKVSEYWKRLNLLASDPLMAENVGIQNRARAMKYSWEKLTPLYDAMWEEVA